MERIRELLAKLAEITSEELAELRGLVVDEFKRLEKEPNTPENVALLTELADAGEALMGEETSRAEQEAANEQAAQAARDRIAAVTDPPAVEEPAAEPAAEEPSEEDPEEPARGREPEPVTAAGPGPIARRAARQGAPQAPPEQAQRERAVLTATGALRGIEGVIPDRRTLAEGMADTLRRLSRAGRSTGDVLLASATWRYPDDRMLDEKNTPEQNTAILDGVIHPDAIVASGGVCAPVNVDYTVPTWASAARPFRDGNPAFGATRGGITFVPPPDIAALAGASGIWTEATDVAPGGAVKPVLAVACAAPVTVYVDAVTTRLQFGNMQSRFSPEQVAANTDLAIAAASRMAEINMLNKLAAFSTANVQNTQTLGATRDLLTAIEQSRAGYLDLHRLDDGTMLTMVLPRWARGIIKTDLLREMAHENNDQFNVLALTNAQIDALLAAHGVRPIWMMDGQPQNGSVYPAQAFPAQAGSGQANKFPTKVVWYLYAEGFVQFLDGGRLDLGVVRDATLDATNDYETFVETWEGLAYRGVSGGSIQYVTTLCANGTTSATAVVGTCA